MLRQVTEKGFRNKLTKTERRHVIRIRTLSRRARRAVSAGQYDKSAKLTKRLAKELDIAYRGGYGIHADMQHKAGLLQATRYRTGKRRPAPKRKLRKRWRKRSTSRVTLRKR